MERWRGRTALVTGSASGIGRAITAQLLKFGVNVVACDLSDRMELVKAIEEEVRNPQVGNLMTVACDVGKEEDILAAFDQIRQSSFKGVDICVNSAGFGDAKKLSEG